MAVPRGVDGMVGIHKAYLLEHPGAVAAAAANGAYNRAVLGAGALGLESGQGVQDDQPLLAVDPSRYDAGTDTLTVHVNDLVNGLLPDRQIVLSLVGAEDFMPADSAGMEYVRVGQSSVPVLGRLILWLSQLDSLGVATKFMPNQALTNTYPRHANLSEDDPVSATLQTKQS